MGLKIKKIIFTNVDDFKDKDYSPKSSKDFLPDWYKKTKSYAEENNLRGTIKKCMPVFDAMVSGYIITTYCDLYVSQIGGETKIESSLPNVLETHSSDQFLLYPNIKTESVPKLLNKWSIKTPKGYSVLICNPMHQDNIFDILEGVVDTDNYSVPINLPFQLKNKDFQGLIPAGTPIAQIIPFKRDSWTHSFGNKKNVEKSLRDLKKIKSLFFNSYKKFFRFEKFFN